MMDMIKVEVLRGRQGMFRDFLHSLQDEGRLVIFDENGAFFNREFRVIGDSESLQKIEEHIFNEGNC